MDTAALQSKVDRFLEEIAPDDDYPCNGVTCNEIFEQMFEDFLEFIQRNNY